MTYTLIGTTPISTAVGAVTTTTGLTGASFASTATSFHGRLDAEWGDGPLHDGAVGGATVARTGAASGPQARGARLSASSPSPVSSPASSAPKSNVITPGADYDVPPRLLSSSPVAHPRRPSPRCYFPCRIPRSRLAWRFPREPPTRTPAVLADRAPLTAPQALDSGLPPPGARSSSAGKEVQAGPTGGHR